MPLTGQIRNQITAQIDAVFDAIEAGTAFDNHEWGHNPINFSAGGRNYVVIVFPDGDLNYAKVMMMIKRAPL